MIDLSYYPEGSKPIGEMKLNEQCFVVSWALHYIDGRLMINRNYPACREKCGTVKVAIIRVDVDEFWVLVETIEGRLESTLSIYKDRYLPCTLMSFVS